MDSHKLIGRKPAPGSARACRHGTTGSSLIGRRSLTSGRDTAPIDPYDIATVKAADDSCAISRVTTLYNNVGKRYTCRSLNSVNSRPSSHNFSKSLPSNSNIHTKKVDRSRRAKSLPTYNHCLPERGSVRTSANIHKLNARNKQANTVTWRDSSPCLPKKYASSPAKTTKSVPSSVTRPKRARSLLKQTRFYGPVTIPVTDDTHMNDHKLRGQRIPLKPRSAKCSIPVRVVLSKSLPKSLPSYEIHTHPLYRKPYLPSKYGDPAPKDLASQSKHLRHGGYFTLFVVDSDSDGIISTGKPKLERQGTKYWPVDGRDSSGGGRLKGQLTEKLPPKRTSYRARTQSENRKTRLVVGKSAQPKTVSDNTCRCTSRNVPNAPSSPLNKRRKFWSPNTEQDYPGKRPSATWHSTRLGPSLSAEESLKHSVGQLPAERKTYRSQSHKVGGDKPESQQWPVHSGLRPTSTRRLASHRENEPWLLSPKTHDSPKPKSFPSRRQRTSSPVSKVAQSKPSMDSSQPVHEGNNSSRIWPGA